MPRPRPKSCRSLVHELPIGDSSQLFRNSWTTASALTKRQGTLLIWGKRRAGNLRSACADHRLVLMSLDPKALYILYSMRQALLSVSPVQESEGMERVSRRESRRLNLAERNYFQPTTESAKLAVMEVKLEEMASLSIQNRRRHKSVH
jgi:hypothetical protein